MVTLPNPPRIHASLLEILGHRAQNQPDQQAYIFLQDGETESDSLTYSELDQQARAIAAHLKPWQGEQALLLYSSGLDFIKAFFGCLYAKVVAVPVYRPRRNQKLSRLLAIANNSQAKIALTTTTILTEIEQRWEENTELSQLQIIATNTIDDNPDNFAPIPIESEDLAFLQYTSGSTGTPKGVMVTHGNIIHNQRLIHQAFGHSENSVGVGWLPLFHDMGLIGHVLQPLYVGFPSVLMPPLAFLANPLRWLKAISKYKATTSGGPNFAYDLCINRISDEQLASLDLSSWDLAYSGAEPVRAETLEKFSQKFSASKFNHSSFYPCYGMAETTLFVTGGKKHQSPIVKTVQPENLVLNESAQTASLAPSENIFVGCGRPYMDTTVAIVDPNTFTCCLDGQVGEIWVSGGSIAAGYWNAPSATEETFQATLEEKDHASFLRTGDLGFFSRGELFVTGRLKDLIIIRGKNHYPHDIELTVQKSHLALRENCGAAFSIDQNGQERLVIVQEVKRTYLRDLDVNEVVGVIRKAVSESHELQAYGVILIKTGSIAKTSSGKIQRHACREAFLNNELIVVGQNILGETGLGATDPATSKAAEISTLLTKLCEQISQELGLAANTIRPDQQIGSLGLDSIQVIAIKGYVEDNFDLTVPMEQFFEDITVAQLAENIVAEANKATDAWSYELVSGESAEHTSENGKVASNNGTGDIDLDSRLRLAFQKDNDVLQKARDFALPDQLRAQGLLPYFRELERNEGATCIFDGRSLVMLGSNNYLGLTADMRVRGAAAKAALVDGPSLTGSRLLNGSTSQHRELEKKLAKFVGHEDALVFTTGYQANLGFISALMNENTTIILDSEAHACIYDGAFMSRCKVMTYQHNDLADLEKKLQQVAGKSATMVTVDGVYSMTGDIAPLPELRALCDRYGATLAVDDAHSLGVLGKTGRGTEEYFDMIGSSDILCGTFSKSLASIGGWVAAEAKVIDWIRFNGRSMLFSASIPPTSLAAASTSLDILIEEPWRVETLHKNAKYWKDSLEKLGFTVGESQTPVIKVLVGDDLKCMVFCKELLEAGVYVNSAVYPAVPRNQASLRTSVMATHTKEHLDKALTIIAEVGRKLEIIS
ncbi:Long-chain-fatty-acid--CoA ligase, Glycine C-acetyltransferase [[Leptolyngbya] sp. PCC 7376]|uniref:aminotransferase class I/II-fold pyridoxal phosphate-dependent enzyme n=1 Tax=[Leptolyngbya] sp. PCC 7376 TaxID=111781 RepID=UPI00029EED19|nr:aminotransferase class I/II-fold pyridoxal phosphate-dependent enzyme [[Leptolyngbya] sp. PCC 7376]AFY38523.1 Long-chain-fatty-acid--CoA ligase, Glycine C-acetyltransferase [[Leptolyngbya] sp. PCC 7376]